MGKRHRRKVRGVVAIRTILGGGIGRYVILEFTEGNHVVMAVGANRRRAKEAQIMIEGTGHKCSRRVTIGAIAVVGRGRDYRISDGGRHMTVDKHAAGRR